MQGKLYMIMEICRAFDHIFKEHLDGVYVLYLYIYFVVNMVNDLLKYVLLPYFL